MFQLLSSSSKSLARRGELKTAHGVIQTPFFMPIATRGAVKTLTTDEVGGVGAQIILSNTYHLNIRPGVDLLKKVKGLHNFMSWTGPILTDSGGYQVFSLSKLRKITEAGVTFRDEIEGKNRELTPENVIDIQMVIGSDIMMILDECPAWPATKETMKESIERTSRWAKRAFDYKEKTFKKKRVKKGRHLVYAIAQGGTFLDLRKQSIQDLKQYDFDGYALGGLAVGEPRDEMYKILKAVTPTLPIDKPRYLMGVGKPEEIVQAVKFGVDQFDCVIPTRHARHGQ